jgi:hypothetical protein
MTKLFRDENGLSRSVLVVAIIVILAIVGLITWSLTKGSPKTNTANSMTTTSGKVTNSETSACIAAYHDSELCSYASNINLFSYAFQSSGTASNPSGTASFVMKNDGNGNHQISYTTASRQLSLIKLDGNTYIQTSAGSTWLEYTSSDTNIPDTVPDPTSYFNMTLSSASAQDYTFTKVGPAACGSQSCMEYSVSVVAKPSVTQHVFFDTSSHQLMEWEYSDASTGGSVNATFTYGSVNIAKPSPVELVTT